MLNINVWDLLWTFVNFFVLYCLLNKFLFQPLTSFMEARQAKIDAGLTAERKAQETLVADKTLLDKERARCSKEAKQILDKARAECDERQALLLDQARDESHRARRQMRDDAQALGRKELESLRSSLGRLAALLADTLLQRK
ncbi:MAG: hypothetical protein DBX49_03200 [Clostridia bacterium]|nr:MAG: hypothetical protein DBX49_03200 [Clostridia bacterium]